MFVQDLLVLPLVLPAIGFSFPFGRGRFNGGIIGRPRITGARGVARRIQAIRKQVQGRGGKSPRDQILITEPGLPTKVAPGQVRTIEAFLWGSGADIAQILTEIQVESPYVLETPTAVTELQPTLFVYGWSLIDVFNAGTADVNFEYIVLTPHAGFGTDTFDLSTDYATGWAQSYDTMPSNYEDYPSTSVLENLSLYSKSSKRGYRPSQYSLGSIKAGTNRRFLFRFKTRRFTWEEYSVDSYFTNGATPNKAFLAIFRFWSEIGQVCATNDGTARPAAFPVGGNILMQTRRQYSYKWVPGNNKPSIRGDYFPPLYVMAEDAASFVGDLGRKNLRYAGYRATDDAAGYPTYGGKTHLRHQEAVINPQTTCAAAFIPDVEVDNDVSLARGNDCVTPLRVSVCP